MCNIVWNLVPKWISKPRLQQHKNHGKTSHGAGKFPQNLRASKKSRYNEQTCKSGRHNQQHTFMQYKSKNRTTTTNMPNLEFEVMARNKGEIKLPPSCRHNRIIRAINHCQDASREEPTDVKQLFCLMMNQTNVMIAYWRIRTTLIVFVLTFLVTVSSHKFLWTPILSTMWFCEMKLYNQPRNQGS